jgi:hypothetical protein
MDANADVTIVSDRGVLLLPNNAIHTTAAGSTVEILDDGKPAAWDIQIGVTDGTKTEVLSGLDPGDAVIVPKSNAAVVRTQPQSPLRGAGPGGPNALFRMIGGR